ncbi:MoxR-like ATPase [Labrys miyagiensis]|uniref:MoxR-like ATPase n=1 Tax=Labrys miyagiensis TaxID=346912 RepID=A0ABQ6CLG8_9HYPH|nr:MoxR family ATPase [Labrys miyagiensis]GLS20467.1 MoxR-like ATPase [Labrys miyagiensis]
MELQHVAEIADGIRQEVGKAIVGQDEVIELMLTGLLCGGHILLEGVPGTGKTLLAQAFASTLSLKFGRVQFTPDMMPGDVLGTNLFNFQTNSFVLTQGPIFTDLLLADEINRTPPKTQAALLQAMNERAVTIDGKTYGLGADFMVVATQNPIEQQGTYPLPEAQLDRFLFKIDVGYPTRDEERAIVTQHGHRSAMPRLSDFGLQALADPTTLADLRATSEQIVLTPQIIDYIVDVVRATRQHQAIETGGSTRSANALASSVRALAALNGRNFVIPDDVKRLALPILRHRIVLAPNAEIDGLTPDRIVREILDQTAAPR